MAHTGLLKRRTNALDFLIVKKTKEFQKASYRNIYIYIKYIILWDAMTYRRYFSPVFVCYE